MLHSQVMTDSARQTLAILLNVCGFDSFFVCFGSKHFILGVESFLKALNFHL